MDTRRFNNGARCVESDLLRSNFDKEKERERQARKNEHKATIKLFWIIELSSQAHPVS